MTEEAGKQEATGNHGAVTGRQELREMIERADSNGDGQITPEAEVLVNRLLKFVALDVHLAEAVSCV